MANALDTTHEYFMPELLTRSLAAAESVLRALIARSAMQYLAFIAHNVAR